MVSKLIKFKAVHKSMDHVLMVSVNKILTNQKQKKKKKKKKKRFNKL